MGKLLWVMTVVTLSLFACLGVGSTATRVFKAQTIRPALALTTSDVPICNTTRDIASDILQWTDTVENMEGVSAFDPDGRIGEFPAKQADDNFLFFGRRFFVGDNWYPLDIYKLALCGELDHFDVYGKHGEKDWNTYIIPSRKYRRMIDDPRPMYQGDEWTNCRGPKDCIDAEVAPENTFFENSLNSRSSDSSRLEGHTICTYGPWVRDEYHTNRPEIHTSELYWWRERAPDGQLAFYLIQVQDDSNRFDSADDYDFSPGGRPPWWRPWPDPPRTAIFQVAFELNPNDPPLNFFVDEVQSRNVVTGLDPVASQDSDSGRENAIVYNGKTVLTVRELQSKDEDLGIRFVGLCRNAENTRLQGYINITSKVGINTSGGEGYTTIKVVTDRLPYFNPPLTPILLPQVLPVVSVVGNESEGSLHRVNSFGRPPHPELLADIPVQVIAGPGATVDDLSTFSVTFISGLETRNLEFHLDPITGLVVSDVPVSKKARLLFSMKSGAIVTLPIDGFTLTPQLVSELPQLTEAQPSAWANMVAAAGGAIPLPPAGGTIQPPAPLLYVQQWQVDAAPHYGPLKGDEISLEDDSTFAEELNAAASGEGRTQELFGTNQPFQVEWSFSAMDLTDPRPVAIRLNGQLSDLDIQVRILDGLIPNGRIQVNFPAQSQDHVIQLEAVEKITDTNGLTNTVKHLLWSHILSGSMGSLVEGVLPAVADIAGAPANDLVSASSLELPEPPDERDSVSRIARMIRLAAMGAARDGQVNVGELSRLIRGGKQFRDIVADQNAPPVCGLFPDNGNMSFIVQDFDSGLAKIEVELADNARVFVPQFTLGTKEPVVVPVIRINTANPSFVRLRLTDVAGKAITCDPAMLTIKIPRGDKVKRIILTDIPRAENKVMILNGDPGLRSLKIIVNGRSFRVTGIAANENRAIDVSSAMVEGPNIIILKGAGEPRAKATVTISD